MLIHIKWEVILASGTAEVVRYCSATSTLGKINNSGPPLPAWDFSFCHWLSRSRGQNSTIMEGIRNPPFIWVLTSSGQRHRTPWILELNGPHPHPPRSTGAYSWQHNNRGVRQGGGAGDTVGCRQQATSYPGGYWVPWDVGTRELWVAIAAQSYVSVTARLLLTSECTPCPCRHRSTRRGLGS